MHPSMQWFIDFNTMDHWPSGQRQVDGLDSAGGRWRDSGNASVTADGPVALPPIDHEPWLLVQGGIPLDKWFNTHDKYPGVWGLKAAWARCTLPHNDVMHERHTHLQSFLCGKSRGKNTPNILVLPAFPKACWLILNVKIVLNHFIPSSPILHNLWKRLSVQYYQNTQKLFGLWIWLCQIFGCHLISISCYW